MGHWGGIYHMVRLGFNCPIWVEIRDFYVQHNLSMMTHAASSFSHAYALVMLKF
jgi:hypothetical protein